jgi:hypothetical protein
VCLSCLWERGLPALWGWLIYRLLKKLWPETIVPDHVRHAPPTIGPAETVDYQI